MKLLTSLFLIAVFGVSALAGAPLHEKEQGCPMGGMMDCCQTAQSRSDAPDIIAAKLCCLLDCQQPGATPSGVSAPGFSPSLAVTLLAFTTQPKIVLNSLAHASSAPVTLKSSHPAYIRHLSLLI